MRVRIVVHGGAGDWSTEDVPTDIEKGCALAAAAGRDVLTAGGSSLDAVVAAVRVLEDDPLFNAGRGGALTRDGTVELDASLMDGASLRAGAVASITQVRHPIELARAVMEHTPHVMFAGEGALALARELKLELQPPEWFVTERARTKLREHRGATGTVGAVAIDAHGRVAAATSTGGMTGKMPGRVGDSPIIGAGTYAEGGAGAASVTGTGEAILRVGVARTVCESLAHGHAASAAARASLERLQRAQGHGGVIVVDHLGQACAAFDTPRMAHAWLDAQGQIQTGFATRSQTAGEIDVRTLS